MSFVLDTNAVSALMKNDGSVVDRLRAVSRSEVSIPQPVLAEIEYGVQRLPRSRKRDLLLARLDLLKSEIQRTSWNDAVSESFGVIKANLERRGERLEDFDIAIAAHAAAAGAVLVTANVKHLQRVSGVRIENWSERGEGED